jgi:hypothetical protein
MYNMYNMNNTIRFYENILNIIREIINNIYKLYSYVFGISYKNVSYKKGRNISPLQKKMVAYNQSWKCKNCNNILDYTYEVDHIIPLYKGGTNHMDNLQALCRNCHGRKTINDMYM